MEVTKSNTEMSSNSINSWTKKVTGYIWGSLKNKIIIGFILIYFLTVFVFGIVIISQIDKAYFEQYRLNASSISAQIINTHLVPLQIATDAALEDLITDYTKIIDIKALAIYD